MGRSQGSARVGHRVGAGAVRGDSVSGAQIGKH